MLRARRGTTTTDHPVTGSSRGRRGRGRRTSAPGAGGKKARQRKERRSDEEKRGGGRGGGAGARHFGHSTQLNPTTVGDGDDGDGVARHIFPPLFRGTEREEGREEERPYSRYDQRTTIDAREAEEDAQRGFREPRVPPLSLPLAPLILSSREPSVPLVSGTASELLEQG